MANFKVDRNYKVVRQRTTDLASLRPTAATPKVSETNEIQYLRSYKDEQREQMQQIKEGMQDDYKRLARAFDKSTIPNFPTHEVESKEKMHDSSAANCHDQSYPLYEISMNTYSKQQQHSAQIEGKSSNLRTTGPSTRERM